MFAYTSTLSTAWQTFMGSSTATPGTEVAMIGNVPNPTYLDIFWIDAAGKVWTRHCGGYWLAAVALNRQELTFRDLCPSYNREAESVGSRQSKLSFEIVQGC